MAAVPCEIEHNLTCEWENWGLWKGYLIIMKLYDCIKILQRKHENCEVEVILLRQSFWPSHWFCFPFKALLANIKGLHGANNLCSVQAVSWEWNRSADCFTLGLHALKLSFIWQYVTHWFSSRETDVAAADSFFIFVPTQVHIEKMIVFESSTSEWGSTGNTMGSAKKKKSTH